MPLSRPANPRTTEARRRAIELRTRGLSTAEIGERLGVTRQGVWRLLSNYGKSETPPPALRRERAFCRPAGQ
jgi:orotate phosphoribosyltransferase-like protein